MLLAVARAATARGSSPHSCSVGGKVATESENIGERQPTWQLCQFFRKRFCSSGASDFPRSIACSVSDWSSGVYIYKYSAWAATCAADGRGVGAREQLVHHHDMLLSHRGRTWRDSEAARLCSGVGAASLTDRASDLPEFKAC